MQRFYLIMPLLHLFTLKNTRLLPIRDSGLALEVTINMRRIFPLFIIAALLVIPVIAITAASYIGDSHPLEGSEFEYSAFLMESDKEKEIVFFGYAGCNIICPQSLTKLDKVFEGEVHENLFRDWGVTFVDISLASSKAKATRYAGTISDHIRGESLTDWQLRSARETFDLRINDRKSAAGTGDIYHTDHFFVLTKTDGYWKIERVLDNNTPVEVIRGILTSY